MKTILPKGVVFVELDIKMSIWEWNINWDCGNVIDQMEIIKLISWNFFYHRMLYVKTINILLIVFDKKACC